MKFGTVMLGSNGSSSNNPNNLQSATPTNTINNNKHLNGQSLIESSNMKLANMVSVSANSNLIITSNLNATSTQSAQANGQMSAQINTISHYVSSQGQDYVSDTEMSERGSTVGRSGRNGAAHSKINHQKNIYQSSQQFTNNISFDQQSIASQLTVKNGSEQHRNNSNQMTASIQSTNQSNQQQQGSGRYNSNNRDENGSGNYHTKQSSKQHANNNNNSSSHNTRQMSQRLVNFNKNEESNYERIKQKGKEDLKVKDASNNKSETKEDSPEKDDDQEENSKENTQQIQVQILPQDDNWGENTTAITGDFSDFNDDMTEDGRSSHYNGRTGKDNNNHHHHHNNIMIDMDNMASSSTYSSWSNRNLICLFYLFCTNYFGFICAICVSFCAFVTPIMFIVLPRLNINQQWQVSECGIECEGLLIGIAFKLFVLLLGAWAIFARKPKASLPRVYELRALLIFLLCIMTFSYWLFYGVRIIETKSQDYHKILQFAVSYVDVLLFIFIISVFILELRHLQPQYVVKVIRSPDGEQSEYTIGKMSIQRAAIWILEQYYKDFAVYNPWLEHAYRKRSAQLLKLEQAIISSSSNNKKSSNKTNNNNNNSRSGSIANFKNYSNEDGKSLKNNENESSNEMMNKKMSLSRMSAARGLIEAANANDRFYEDYEYERRLKKRRARLMTTTEEAFTHIRRIQLDSSGNCTNGSSQAMMDPFEAAQAIFTSIARDLRRYLRVTRQQPYFTRESIVAHLANCISYDMSPRSFLQRYLNPEPLIFNERALVNASAEQHQKLSSILPNVGVGSHGVNYNLNLKTIDQSWILICDTSLYQNVEDNLMLVLKQNEVSLMCTFKQLPRFNLIEDILDPMRNKFILKLNSETTV